MNIQQSIKKYIKEGGQAQILTLHGEPGVLFTADDDNHFIPWATLAYNEELGFYDIAQFPGQVSEMGGINFHPVRYRVQGGLNPDDDYTVWAVIPDDDTGPLYIGEWGAVLKLNHVLSTVIESGAAEWVDELDNDLSHPWLNPSEAARLAATRNIKCTSQAIHYACQRGEIRLATRETGGWRMPQRSFLTWLVNRPKPGPKKGKKNE